MDSFELNKIAGAILGAGLLIMVINEIGNILVHPVTDVSVLGIETEGADTAVAAAAPAEEAEPLPVLLAAGDAESGARVARKCTACHTFDQGGANKVGPNLWGVLGRTKGAVDGFSYSAAMADHGGIWGYQEMHDFLAKPRDYLPGTKMAFAGLRRPAEIADIIAYLRENHDSAPPLPTE